MDPSPPPALRPIGLAPMQFMQSSDDQIARSRALATAADPDVAQRNVYGYTGSGYGNYSTAERQAAAGLASMYYGRPMMGVRFQGGARTIQGGARTKPMKVHAPYDLPNGNHVLAVQDEAQNAVQDAQYAVD